MSDLRKEIEKRRTFAIISHPDAGKTTLTEKFLLYGGAINLAGSVKGKATARHAVSDWMEIEKQRGISVTSSVLQFNYDGYCINILDTPGHQDFSEDTYRTLMAADSAVMVIDASKGVEAQTRKLFKVCVMRHIPIFTFINKMDRDANDTFELLDDIENELGIATYPVNWPIGSGKEFKGVYDRHTRKVMTFADTLKGTKEGSEKIIDIDDPALIDEIGEEKKSILDDEIELLDGASAEFDMELVTKGELSPETFMEGIESMAKELIARYSHISEDKQKLFAPQKESVGVCPRCGQPVFEGKKNFYCGDRGCGFVLWKNDRFWTSRRKELTKKMAADLLSKGKTKVKGLYSEKKDTTYDAVIVMEDTGGKYINFKTEFTKGKGGR